MPLSFLCMKVACCLWTRWVYKALYISVPDVIGSHAFVLGDENTRFVESTGFYKADALLNALSVGLTSPAGSLEMALCGFDDCTILALCNRFFNDLYCLLPIGLALLLPCFEGVLSAPGVLPMSFLWKN